MVPAVPVVKSVTIESISKPIVVYPLSSFRWARTMSEFSGVLSSMPKPKNPEVPLLKLPFNPGSDPWG
jgi:hypothetical protein